VDEQVLRDFFVGDASGKDLAANVHGSVSHPSERVSIVHISDMDDELTVARRMAVKLCDAVLNGDLPAEDLATIGFALIASDRFGWDEDDLLANVIADWSCPEINYPLTIENIARFKRWLLESEPYPEKPRSPSSSRGRLVSVKEKRSTKRPCGSPSNGI
jgi:hypothetical protein